jgi:DNA primase
VYSKEIIEKIRSANPIGDVIGEFLPLKPSGKNLKAACPFHQEKTPSFFVDPERDRYHCFGCQADGDVFEFLVAYEKIDFPEAVEKLAARAGIPLPVGKDAAGVDPLFQEKERQYALLAWACGQYQSVFLSSPLGRGAQSYARRRGLNREVVQRFAIGFAPLQWDWLRLTAQKAGFTEQALLRSGLAVESTRTPATLYDRFRGRLLFPIHDETGRVIAFGGRALGEEQPKYLNSPETEIYHKGDHLFAYHLAKHSARKAGYFILVEGYMDAIACHRAGWEQTVASLGTALTAQQAQRLKRYAPKVLLWYDQDTAGVNAAIKAYEILAPLGLEVRAIRGGNFKDPDEYFQSGAPPEALPTLARPIFEFGLEAGLERFPQTGSVDKKQALVQFLAPLYQRIPAGIEKQEALYRLLSALYPGLNGSPDQALVDAVTAELHRFTPRSPSPSLLAARIEEEPPKPKPVPSVSVEGAWLLALLYQFPVLQASLLAELEPTDFVERSQQKVFLAFQRRPCPPGEDHEAFWQESFRSDLSADEQSGLDQALSRGISDDHPEKVARDLAGRLRRARLRRELSEIQTLLERAQSEGDWEEFKRLAAEKKRMVQALHATGVLWHAALSSLDSKPEALNKK